MKKKLLIASLLALTGTGAMAQSSFEGFYGQLGIGYGISSPDNSTGSGTASVRGFTVPLNFTTTANQSKTFLGAATVGYYVAVSNDFLLGIGAEYTKNASKWTPNVTSNNYGVSVKGQYQIQSSYNFFLSPAYAIDKDKLVYGKVGYISSATKLDTPGTTAESTQNNNGYSLGLGYKQIITGGWYGFGEANYSTTSNKQYSNSGANNGNSYTATVQSGSSQNYQLLAGVGYTF